MIDLTDTVIIEMMLKLDTTSEIQQNEVPSLLSEKTKTSKHSQPSKSLSYNTSTSSVRAKAFAELATSNEQAEFDVLIAEKEKARRECEAQDELRKATERAKYDHDMAILKARKLKAVANVKLDAIEQSVDSKDTAIRKLNVKHEDTSKRTRTWLGDQRQVINDNNSEELSDLYEQKETITNLPTNYHPENPVFHRKVAESQDNNNQHRPSEMQYCFNAIVATNERLVESLAKQSLPKYPPDLFTGDVTMFYAWKQAFKAMIRDTGISPEQEVNYLYKYTSGEPQRLLNSFRKCQRKDPKKLLSEVWTELESQFGIAAITHSLLEQLRENAKFEENYRKRLLEFSDLCADVVYQLDELPCLACLIYPTAIRPIAEKLPVSLQRKWEKKVAGFAIEHHDAYPGFRVFAKTIGKQAKLRNHPNIVSEETQKKKWRPGKHPEECRILKADVEDDNKTYCLFHSCDGHKLKDCKTFARKTLQEKIEWIRKAGLCFRCLSSKHIARDCKADIKCAECDSDQHSALLHREKKKDDEEKKAGSAGDRSEVTSSCTEICKNDNRGLSASKIVLVDVSLRERPNDTHRVYVLLDEQSNASLISPKLTDKLGIKGKSEKYLLSTCSGSKEVRYG